MWGFIIIIIWTPSPIGEMWGDPSPSPRFTWCLPKSAVATCKIFFSVRGPLCWLHSLAFKKKLHPQTAVPIQCPPLSNIFFFFYPVCLREILVEPPPPTMRFCPVICGQPRYRTILELKTFPNLIKEERDLRKCEGFLSFF